MEWFQAVASLLCSSGKRLRHSPVRNLIAASLQMALPFGLDKLIYLDYNATTPLAPEAIEAMRSHLSLDATTWANPSSGKSAKAALERARAQVASLLGSSSDEVVFTSGGTEANNYAIKGVAFASAHRGKHLVSSAFEHSAVLEVFKYLEGHGFTTTYVPVDELGHVDLDALERAITPSTTLVTIMHANNEVGTVQPIRKIVEIVKRKNPSTFVHSDTSQTIGKLPVRVADLAVDLLTVTPHKFYGPKGIGALYRKAGVPLEKFMHGAGHEHGQRSGTENVLLAVALGAACELVERNGEEYARHMRSLRDLLKALLTENIPGVRFNGDPERMLPNTLSVSFPSLKGYEFVNALGDELCVSAGSACHADSESISPVLKAMGIPLDQALGTVRAVFD